LYFTIATLYSLSTILPVTVKENEAIYTYPQCENHP